MNATYDHLVAIVIVVALFIGTVVAVPATMSFNISQSVDQQQMRNTALNLFNAILQGTGSPLNWGSKFPFDQNSVLTFGLASSSPFSSYILDSDKVQRLDPQSPGYINYSYVKDLLKMQGYGFQFSLFRPFKVAHNIQFTGQSTVQVSVNVTRTEDGAPIPGSTVKTTIIVTASKANSDEPIFIIDEMPSKYTDLQGRCQILESVNLPTGYTLQRAVAILHITVTGMETMVVASKDESVIEYLKINTFGDDITLTMRGEYMGSPPGATWVERVFAYDLQTLITLYDGSGENADKINNGYGYDYWTGSFPGLSTIDPAILVLVLSVPNPRRLVVVAGPLSFGNQDKIFEFGGNPTANILTTMRRLVIISGMTYVSELLMWKE
ncbi:hypothetical protein E2P42_02860 [Candidatus Bathyarchaeota archaeon]|nr:hypothetical protein E2P42_02860 [Candidatus Bathyarchaeota archaeon]